MRADLLNEVFTIAGESIAKSKSMTEEATAPAKAYYTIEISPDGTVCQVRGEYNRQYADIQQVNAFLARWKSVVEKRKVGGHQRLGVRSTGKTKNPP